MTDEAFQTEGQMRFGVIREIIKGKATLKRPTHDQTVCLALLSAGAMKVRKEKERPENYRFMPALTTTMSEMLEMSPGVNGAGIDGALKAISPVPIVAIPGAATEAKQGVLSSIISVATGKKKEEG